MRQFLFTSIDHNPSLLPFRGCKRNPGKSISMNNPAASCGYLKTARADGSSVTYDIHCLGSWHTCLSWLHRHAFQPCQRKNHPSKILHPTTVSWLADNAWISLAPSRSSTSSLSLSHCMSVPTESENEHDPCPSLFPKTSFGSVSQFPNIPLSKPHQPCRQTLLVGTLPEIPTGTSEPLRCDSYGYIRSSTKLTPQAAGNSTRRD